MLRRHHRLTLFLALLTSLLLPQEFDAASYAKYSVANELAPTNDTDEVQPDPPGDSSTDPVPRPDTKEWESSDLQTVLAAVMNLTASQNHAMNQQKVFQEERKSHIEVLDNRETTLLNTLKGQEEIMQTIQKRVSRKLRNVSKAKKAVQAVAGVACGISEGPKDCADIYMNGDDVSGVYRVFPAWTQTSFKVFCDMDTDEGGWTVIQRRGKFGFAEDYFQKSWSEYKNGFGDLETEFWLGNDRLWSLTKQGAYRVRYDIRGENSSQHVIYDSIWIESESQNYRMHLGNMEPVGNASDVLSKSSGQYFSTKDKNQDSCAIGQKRGWWYNGDCELSPQLGGIGSRKVAPTSAPRQSHYYSERDRQLLAQQEAQILAQYRQEVAEAEEEIKKWRQALTELKIRPVHFLDHR